MSSMILPVEGIPFLILGTVVGIAYLADYWISSKESKPPLSKLSDKFIDKIFGNAEKIPTRIRGLTYIFGGAIFPGLKELLGNKKSESPGFMGSYFLGSSSTILAGLVILATSAFYISFRNSCSNSPAKKPLHHSSEALKGSNICN
jgi:hypothetical protein